MIHFRCSHVAPLKVNNHAVEKMLKCPKCFEVIKVPRTVGELTTLDSNLLPVVTCDHPLVEVDSSDSVPTVDYSLQPSTAKTGTLFMALAIVALLVVVPFVILLLVNRPDGSAKRWRKHQTVTCQLSPNRESTIGPRGRKE